MSLAGGIRKVSPLPLYIRGASFPSLIRLLRGHSGERLLLPCWIEHPIWIPLPDGLLLPGRKQLATPRTIRRQHDKLLERHLEFQWDHAMDHAMCEPDSALCQRDRAMCRRLDSVMRQQHSFQHDKANGDIRQLQLDKCLKQYNHLVGAREFFAPPLANVLRRLRAQ